MPRRALLLVALLVAGVAWPSPLYARARSLVIESFDAEIHVQQDGTIDVTETIRPRFTGLWNGIYRTIPVEYRTPQGLNYTLLLDLQSITDEAGHPFRYEQSRERHYRMFKIWIPGAMDATKTVVLRYRVRNGLKFFEDHDELYWNVTGDEWEVPIRAAAARVHLPPAVDGVRAVAFTGGYSSREQAASVDIGLTFVEFKTRRPLNFREGLTVAVAWNPGVITRPGPLDRAALFVRSNWVLLAAFAVPLAVFVAMFTLWYRRGRDPRRRPIAARYEPPDGLTPAEVGTLIDDWPDMRDITATLVDLAVRGYMVIEEKEAPQLFGLLRGEYVFRLRKNPEEWKELEPHERAILEAVFLDRGRRDPVELSQLENDFYRELPGIRDRIFERLLKRRYLARRPDKIRARYYMAAVAVGILVAFGATLIVNLAPYLEYGGLAAMVAGLVSAAVIAGFGRIMPARTLQGARALEGVLGFEEFLTRVEADRLQRMVAGPETFEKYLPYAMALGVEKNWARAFEGIYRQPPEWYRGTDFAGFSSTRFTSSLGQMSGRVATVMTSAPRSSGGSAFGGGGSSGGGGGGSSGGGFGGGGGGGF